VDLPRFRGDPETGGNSLRKELSMPRSRPPYPREFREEAVRLVRSLGRPIAQIARELGIAHGTLSAWVKQAELDAGLRSDGLVTAEREELRRLRRENRILREEREILNKAAAFFARETESREEAGSVLFAYLEGFYNRRRRHSALGHPSPEEFERRWSADPESVSVTPSTKAG
jgi:transposase